MRLLSVARLAMLGQTLAACAHSTTLGLVSDGDLSGRVIDASRATVILEGESCGPYHYLSSAFRRAIEATDFDTLIDVEVTTTTHMFVVKNCIHVRGRALRSSDLRLEPAGAASSR